LLNVIRPSVVRMSVVRINVVRINVVRMSVFRMSVVWMSVVVPLLFLQKNRVCDTKHFAAEIKTVPW
jgi:hypothetical protein